MLSVIIGAAMQEISRDPNKANCYFKNDNTRILRIELSDKKTFTLTVNPNLRAMIMIRYNRNQNPILDCDQSGTRTFRGDLDIRIAAMPQYLGSKSCEDIMRDAFVSLELENAFVEIITLRNK
jgi:hypothetical protein